MKKAATAKHKLKMTHFEIRMGVSLSRSLWHFKNYSSNILSRTWPQHFTLLCHPNKSCTAIDDVAGRTGCWSQASQQEGAYPENSTAIAAPLAAKNDEARDSVGRDRTEDAPDSLISGSAALSVPGDIKNGRSTAVENKAEGGKTERKGRATIKIQNGNCRMIHLWRRVTLK
jgi:hypothetical protein